MYCIAFFGSGSLSGSAQATRDERPEVQYERGSVSFSSLASISRWRGFSCRPTARSYSAVISPSIRPRIAKRVVQSRLRAVWSLILMQ